MSVLVFDIETVPDVNAGRRLFNLENLNDAEVAEYLFHRQRQATQRDFLPHYLHQVVAISVVFRDHQQVAVWSLGEESASEKTIIQRFFDGIERYSCTLVSWNGGGFDLPVLHYRALFNHVNASRYWEQGDSDNGFRWNNYISRYHQRHTDLMDVLAMYSGRANAPLDDVATLLGFPGKMGMSGGKVWDTYREGNIKAIRDYCETDVLNTYLVYMRYQVMRGYCSNEQYESEITTLKNYLKNQSQSHFNEFLESWEQSTPLFEGSEEKRE